MKNRANDKNKQRSLWVEAWRRLRKNKLAMAGLCFILLLVVLALFTVAVDLITHNTFYTEHVVKQNLRLRLQGPLLPLAFPLSSEAFLAQSQDSMARLSIT